MGIDRSWLPSKLRQRKVAVFPNFGTKVDVSSANEAVRFVPWNRASRGRGDSSFSDVTGLHVERWVGNWGY